MTTITRAERCDLQQILDLQYLAYRSEAELLNDFRIPPLLQTLQGAASGIRNGRRTESDRRLRQNRRLRPRAYGRSHAVHRQTDRRASTTEKRDRHRTARIDRKRVSTDANSSQAIAAFGTWLFIGGWATVLSPKERPIPECGSSIWKNFPGRKTFRRAKSRNYEKKENDRQTAGRFSFLYKSRLATKTGDLLFRPPLLHPDRSGRRPTASGNVIFCPA